MTVTAQYRDLAAKFLDPKLSESERELTARIVADANLDLQRGVQFADAVQPGLVETVLEGADRWPTYKQQRETLNELRAFSESVSPRPVVSDSFSTGLSGGLPLVRELAMLETGTENAGSSPVVPGIVAGPDTGDIDPVFDGSLLDGTWTIDDVGALESWHWSIITPAIGKQLKNFATPQGLAMLDALVLDVVDRGAEKHIGAAILSAASTTAEPADTAAIPAAIDLAEAQASTALNAPADLMLVNPADWPKVRRIVAESWTHGPAPRVVVSVGVTAGTFVLTGREAFTLLVRDHEYLEADAPSIHSVNIGVGRPFYCAIRNEDAIRAIELPA
jgi:hypothetical protein